MVTFGYLLPQRNRQEVSVSVPDWGRDGGDLPLTHLIGKDREQVDGDDRSPEDGPLRYKAILRAVDGISGKVLAETLRGPPA